MPSIPQDVWYHVAEFLPESILEKLLTVNSAFFNISMNIRYRTIYFRGFNAVETKRNTKLLTDNAMVAKRVRRLVVHLEPASAMGVMPWERIPESQRINKKSFSALRLMSTIVLGLNNVVELYVRAKYRAFHDCSQVFFTSAWKAFGANLRILTIEGKVDCLRIPFSLDHPGSVQELCLHLNGTPSTSDDLYDDPFDNTGLHELVMPLVNRFAPELQHLLVTFTDSEQPHGMVSHFFSHLDALPNLQRLTVHLPFHHFTDFTGLMRLLHNHAHTLQHVDMRLTGNDWIARATTEEGLATLMEKYANDEATFKDLKTLVLRPMTLGTCNPLIMLLSRSADSLTKLALLERYLTHDEVASITNVFAHRPPIDGLETICLTVDVFTPHLLTLLATNLRGLKRLFIFCYEWGRRMVHESDKEKLHFFRTHLKGRKQHFVNWGLLKHPAIHDSIAP